MYGSGRDRATMERDFLPNFVNKQLAYWRVSTEGEAERRLFARIDAGEDVPPDRGRTRPILRWGTR